MFTGADACADESALYPGPRPGQKPVIQHYSIPTTVKAEPTAATGAIESPA